MKNKVPLNTIQSLTFESAGYNFYLFKQPLSMAKGYKALQKSVLSLTGNPPKNNTAYFFHNKAWTIVKCLLRNSSNSGWTLLTKSLDRTQKFTEWKRAGRISRERLSRLLSPSDSPEILSVSPSRATSGKTASANS